MNSLATSTRGLDLHKIQQIVKWTVYSLLVLNFTFYIYEDVDRVIHTLTGDSPLIKWASEFATTIDTLAWFILLFMFELETYLVEDEDWNKWTTRFVHTARVVCYLMIAHTVFAFWNGVADYSKTIPVEGVTELCQLVDRDMSYVYNLEYTEINEQTCGQLSDAKQFYQLGNNPLVTSYAGLKLERHLVWSDLVEVLVWLIIIFAMEVVVRLQNLGITGGTLRRAASSAKLAGYTILFGLALYWASLSHWLYTWDTFLWIGGFAAIEMNVSNWRDELRDEEASPGNQPATILNTSSR